MEFGTGYEGEGPLRSAAGSHITLNLGAADLPESCTSQHGSHSIPRVVDRHAANFLDRCHWHGTCVARLYERNDLVTPREFFLPFHPGNESTMSAGVQKQKCDLGFIHCLGISRRQVERRALSDSVFNPLGRCGTIVEKKDTQPSFRKNEFVDPKTEESSLFAFSRISPAAWICSKAFSVVT